MENWGLQSMDLHSDSGGFIGSARVAPLHQAEVRARMAIFGSFFISPVEKKKDFR